MERHGPTTPSGPEDHRRLLYRVRLCADGHTRAILPLLHSGAAARNGESGHRLMWSLFADHPARRGDFLWAAVGPEEFVVLAARRAVNRHELVELDGPEIFAPELRSGDRLRFRLHANPTAHTRTGDRTRGRRHDAVTHALRRHPPADRAAVTPTIVDDVGRRWLERTGSRHGFTPDQDTVSVRNYEQHHVERHEPGPLSYATMDLEGELTVTEPEHLLHQVHRGFGGAKAYGCGLLRLRRAG